VIPFGVLSASGNAEVVSVSTLPGDVQMSPALKFRMRLTAAEFDSRFHEGADYVIVPAMVHDKDPALLTWIRTQAAKGGVIVSICDGAKVVANTGLMNGHRATAHWASESLRKAKYPEVHWEKNIRFVADGRIVSSAGISACIPISIALVEAIAGRDRAASLARELGVTDWSSKHNSDVFQFRLGEKPNSMGNEESAESFGVPVATGVDEVALALTAEVYSHTGRGQAVTLAASAAPVETLHGLLVVPDRIIGRPPAVDHLLPAIEQGSSTMALDKALAAIATSYGRPIAYQAARIMEYPGFAAR